MKLQSINSFLDDYRKALESGSAQPESLFRLCSKNWIENFKIDKGDLVSIIERSLSNKTSGRLWGGENYSIKSGLLLLGELNEDLMRESIRDLLNEDRQLIMRINRFIHHCDVVLEEKERKKNAIHAHYQTYYSGCLILALHYPDKYCLYDFEVFEKFCALIEHPNIPTETDLERYYKIMRIINGIISKETDFMECYYSLLPDDVYLGPALETCYDFIRYTAENSKS